MESTGNKNNFNFKLVSSYKPKGSQPEAIKGLYSGLKKNFNFQTLLGVTGSGKTFTIANIIEKYDKSTLVIAHNKTLATQLYNEFKDFFPNNRVEFFISYYDYYQPESYIPQRDQYIEKDIQINPKIEQMRLATTASLSSRDDVIVIASVSAIYNVGDPKLFANMGFEIGIGQNINRNLLIGNLIDLQFERNDTELMPGRFKVKGETIDIIPGYFNNIIRVEMFGNEIERLSEIDKVTGEIIETKNHFYFYPAKHFVIPESSIKNAIKNIKSDLFKKLPELDMMEAHRLKQRTLFDIEMIEETGFCKGIENYSRYFDGRKPGERPYCLMDYFPKDFLLIIDESHQTIPQLHAMYNGDYSRKKNLVDYGFRLPSAFDNRPLKFVETEKIMLDNKVIFVSATPGDYEQEQSSAIIEQIIRPTGLIDPEVFIRPIKGQIEDLKSEIKNTIKRGDRVLITTLTKKLAEEMTEFLADEGIKTRYMHSEIDTLERTEIIRMLRLGKFDVLVGINLLREGLDIPEVGFIGILDADKEGFLRDFKSLIQIIGRAARNINSKVVLYADKKTKSIIKAIEETKRRRELQMEYNSKHGITPKTIIKPVEEKDIILKDIKHIPKKDIPHIIKGYKKDMQKAADTLDFERAIFLRDKIKELKHRIS